MAKTHTSLQERCWHHLAALRKRHPTHIGALSLPRAPRWDPYNIESTSRSVQKAARRGRYPFAPTERSPTGLEKPSDSWQGRRRACRVAAGRPPPPPATSEPSSLAAAGWEVAASQQRAEAATRVLRLLAERGRPGDAQVCGGGRGVLRCPPPAASWAAGGWVGGGGGWEALLPGVATNAGWELGCCCCLPRQGCLRHILHTLAVHHARGDATTCPPFTYNKSFKCVLDNMVPNVHLLIGEQCCLPLPLILPLLWPSLRPGIVFALVLPLMWPSL